jgi:hypothetical protein
MFTGKLSLPESINPSHKEREGNADAGEGAEEVTCPQILYHLL